MYIGDYSISFISLPHSRSSTPTDRPIPTTKHLFILAAVVIALIFTSTLAPRVAQFTHLFTKTVNGGFDCSKGLKEDLCPPYKGDDDWTGVSFAGCEYYKHTLSFCVVSTQHPIYQTCITVMG